MSRRTQTIAKMLGVLCASGLSACDTRDKPTTEVPGGSGANSTPGGQCLHSEGCCGGHTQGDGSCGATKAETEPATGAATRSHTPFVPQRFEWTVEPGKFAEINLELGDGAKVSASFESDAAVAWNVHSHVGNEATIHAEGTATAGAPVFAAAPGGLYSYLWANKGTQTVTLTVVLRIEGSGRVHSTHP